MSLSVRLDSSLSSSEEMRFLRNHTKLIDKLMKTAHFNKRELQCVLLIYYKFKKTNGGKEMTDQQFLDVLRKSFDMTDEFLVGRIMCTLHKSPTKYIKMEEWIQSLSLLLYGTLHEKIDYCFAIYDIHNRRMLSRETMFNFLRSSLLSQSGEDTEDSVKDLLEVMTKKMDLDRDGKISYDDYKQSVENEPMLLEVFGQCLPTRNSIHAFLSTYVKKLRKEY